MLHFITKIIKVEPYRLTLLFNTGEVKTVDLEQKIRAKSTSPDSKFKALLDRHYFSTVQLQTDWQTIYWDNGIDFCPDVLYQLAEK